MENISNIETYLKIIIGIIGAIATFGKLRENFDSLKRKQELKVDLEIFEKLKNNNEFSTQDLEEKIKLKLKSAFLDRTYNLNNFFVGIAVFIGFGFWSIDLLRNYEYFNGWVILTLFLSMIGLTMILGNSEDKDEGEIFLKVAFYGKKSFQFGVILSLVCGILTGVLIWKLDGFSFWQFLTGLLFIVSITTILRSIKRLK